MNMLRTVYLACFQTGHEHSEQIGVRRGTKARSGIGVQRLCRTSASQFKTSCIRKHVQAIGGWIISERISSESQLQQSAFRAKTRDPFQERPSNV